MQVQEIKDVVSLAIGIGELLDSVADGVSLGDIFQVVGVLKKVKPAIDAVKSGKIVDELKALDQPAKDDLEAWFVAEFDIKSDQVEAVVEQGFKAILELTSLLDLLPKSKP